MEILLMGYSGIVANPNCSTIQIMLPFGPCWISFFDLKKLVLSTYQSVFRKWTSGNYHPAKTA